MNPLYIIANSINEARRYAAENDIAKNGWLYIYHPQALEFAEKGAQVALCGEYENRFDLHELLTLLKDRKDLDIIYE